MYMMYKQEIEKNGYIIVKHVFKPEQLKELTNVILNYIQHNKTISNARGITIPDFIKISELNKVSMLKENEVLHRVLNEIFEGNYRFCSHNDIGINRIVGWHKDKLNNEYAKFETHDIWSTWKDEKHEIVKVLIYFQDHSNNNDGLKVVSGSHKTKEMDHIHVHQLRPSLGDVVIFDQRITHRGMDKQVSHPRILVSFGFGKNNIFTDNFEKGTSLRQHKQNGMI